MKSDLMDRKVFVLAETDKAIRVRDVDSGKSVWLPRSMIEIERDPESARGALVTLPEWLAIEKGLE